MGRVEEAILACQHAVELDPRQAGVWINLCLHLGRQGRETEALQACQRAVEIDPSNFRVWNELGILHFKQGAYRAAADAFGKAMSLAPGCGRVCANLALTYSHAGRDAEAIPLYQKGVNLLTRDSEKALLLSRIGDVCLRLEDHQNSKAAYQRALDFGAETAWFGSDLDAVPHSLLQTERAGADGQPGKCAPVKPAAVQPAREVTLQADAPAREEEEIISAAPVPVTGEADESLMPGEMPLEQPGALAEEFVEKACGAFEQTNQSPGEGFATGLRNDGQTQPPQYLAEETVPGSAQPEASAGVRSAQDSTILSRGDLLAGAAEEGVEEPVDHEPENASEWNALGNEHFKTGLYDEAIIAYIRAVELTPGFNWPYINNLALAYQQKGRHKGVEDVPFGEQQQNEEPSLAGAEASPAPGMQAADRSAAVERGASWQEALPSAGEETMSDHDDDLNLLPPAASVNLMKEAMQEDVQSRPRGVRFQTYGMETSFPELSNSPRASSSAGLETNLDNFIPANAREWGEMGNALLKAGSYDRAMSAYSQAIVLAPEEGWPYCNLALAYCYKRRYAEAIPLYQKSIELFGSRKEKAEAWNRLGDAYRRMNDHDNAKAAYQRAAELDAGASSLLKRARLVLLGNRHN
jgi:tetratricopeptide (TPR) repeat protein